MRIAMPWKPMKILDLRLEFVELASHEAMPMNQLCERFGMSRKTGYKWLQRYRSEGKPGLVNRPRTPLHISERTPRRVEALLLQLRLEHPAWCARKLWHILTRRGITPCTCDEHDHPHLAPERSDRPGWDAAFKAVPPF